ncbi:MAG: serine/threonine protein kinase [Gammaproteobacteria bacterium]|nr:serine/threonine protein kinase [Gammaproteobacteria bacterium]
MASVYLAVQESLGRLVALKVLHPAFAAIPEFSERFFNEGRILASLTHTHIIPIYDIRVHEGNHCIAMEYVEGGDLRLRMADGVTPEQATRIVLAIARALSSAHEAGVIHRDVKPANVLFRLDGTPLLSDFGIAKRSDYEQSLTQVGSRLGSPLYFSPEQVEGQELDARSDIYSLGIIFAELLAGRGANLPGSASTDKPSLREIPSLPSRAAKYQPVLTKMLAKHRDERIPSCASLVPTLEALLEAGEAGGRAPEITGAVGLRSAGVAANDELVLTEVDAPEERTLVLPLADALAVAANEPLHRTPTSVSPAHAPLTMVALGFAAFLGLAFWASTALNPPWVEAGRVARTGAPTPAPPDPAEMRLTAFIALGSDALQQNLLTTPPDRNAKSYFEKALALDAENQEAAQGLEKIPRRYGLLLRKAIRDAATAATPSERLKHQQRVEQLLKNALGNWPDHPELVVLAQRATALSFP